MRKKTDTITYPTTINRRFQQIIFNMADNKVNGIFVSYLPNIRYLTNFTGSFASILIKNDEIHFFTDDRYEEQIKDELFEIPNLVTHITRDVWGYCRQEKLLDGITSFAIEAEHLNFNEAIFIRQLIHSKKIKFKAINNLVEKFTMPKSKEEIKNIQASCNIAERVFEHILNFIKPGMSELDVAIEIDYQARLLGAEGPAFDTIVTSGKRGALVHGQPSNKKIKKNEIILMDFGCRVNGFCSDISRTICVGTPTKEQKNIYNLIYNAMSKAIAEVRPVMKGHFLDAIARNMIEEAGYSEYFKHSLGHGLGLMCHEKPIITFRMSNQTIPEDVVLAIEPGIYLPEKFGIRVEDDVLVTKKGSIKLTNAPNELICI